MSTNVRRQLGPARKRLGDRMDEMNQALEKNDVNNVKVIRVKLKANIEYHEKLTEQLCALSGLPEEEQEIVEAEIDKCTNTNMDCQELMCMANELIDDGTPSDSKLGLEIQVKQTEKLEHEIEKLKLENDAARKRIDDMLSAPKPTTVSVPQETRRKVKLPTIPIVKFNGDILKWPAFWDSFTSTVDNDETLSKVDKFNHLMGALEGEARDSVVGLMLNMM